MKYKKFFCSPCLFGYVLISLTLFSLFQQIRPYEDSCITKGQLIDYRVDTSTDSDRRTRTSYSGIYEFSDGSNTYKAYSVVGTGSVNNLLKEVDVEYEKAEPTINRIKSDLGFTHIFFIIMGCIAIGSGIFFYELTENQEPINEEYEDFDTRLGDC